MRSGKMKKVFAIIALILIIAGPLFAGGAGEVFWEAAGKGALYGATAGATAGLAGVGIGAIPGAIFGAVAGFITGGIIGANKQNAADEQTITENEGVNGQLELTNESILAQNDSKVQEIEALKQNIEPQRVALAKWQDKYDTDIALNQDTAEQNLKALKENWGLYNATLASQNREGATARILSQEQKNRVITYAGEDMELNKDVVSDIRAVYEDESNFDEKGNLTEEGAQKLVLQDSKYGVYDQQMANLAVDLMQGQRSTQNAINNLQGQISTKQKEIDLNNQAMALNEQTIQELKKNNTKLASRRWGSSN